MQSSGATGKPAERRPVRVEYLGARRITLFSPTSMRSYTFDAAPPQRVQLVAAQDAVLLLKRRTFRKTR